MEYLLILLVNLIWLPTLKFIAVTDDAMHIKTSPDTFGWPFRGRKGVVFARMVNITIHVLIAEYIYMAFGNILVALLFSVHPFGVQVAAWRSGRQYGINALLFMMAVAFAPIGSLAYLACFNGAAPTILFTPLAFITTKYWWLAFMVIPIGIINYLNIRKGVVGKIKGSFFYAGIPDDSILAKFNARKLIIVVKTFGYYSLACLLPIKNGFYNSFLANCGMSKQQTAYWFSLNRHFWGGLLAIGIVGTALVLNFHNIIGFGLMLFILSIAPFLNFITIQQYVAPRYAYLPLIGFQVALVGLLAKMGIFTQLVAIPALFAIYLDRLLRVMKHYEGKNKDLMYYDSDVFPDCLRLWYYKFHRWLELDNPIMAWAEAAWGLKYNPNDCQLYFGMAVASWNMGNRKGAEFFIGEAEKNMIDVGKKDMVNIIAEFKDRMKKGVPGVRPNPSMQDRQRGF